MTTYKHLHKQAMHTQTTATNVGMEWMFWLLGLMGSSEVNGENNNIETQNQYKTEWCIS